MPESEQQRTVREAEARGRQQAKVEARLDSHDSAINDLGRIVTGVEHELRVTNSSLSSLSEKVEKRDAVSTALTAAAQDAVARQVTRREFYLGVATLVVSVVAATLTILAAHG
jgi:hypothetical protein